MEEYTVKTDELIMLRGEVKGTYNENEDKLTLIFSVVANEVEVIFTHKDDLIDLIEFLENFKDEMREK